MVIQSNSQTQIYVGTQT